MTNDRIHAIRLCPGDDLKISLEKYVADHAIKAGWMITCAGSVTTCAIRFAGQPGPVILHGPFEILSLTGTLSVNGSHLHVCLSDEKGQTVGGHLMGGNLVYTTAEIIIGESINTEFMRVKDGTTAWAELHIEKKD